MRVLITGISGVGKTTTAAELQKYGYVVIDLDATGFCIWKSKGTKEPTEYEYNGRNRQWLYDHGWYCDIEKLDTLLSLIRNDKKIFVVGISENILELTSLFDFVFKLELDDGLLLERLNTRIHNQFGKRKGEQDFILSEVKNNVNRIKNAIKIDSGKKPELIVNEILGYLE